MAIVVCVTALILVTILSTNVAGEGRFENKNRKCVPAEAEPTLKSSSCYPLLNFTRPFCQNRGITLDNYVFRTPQLQISTNDDMNANFDQISTIGIPRISQYLKVNESFVRKCISTAEILFCRAFFPRCDGTQNVFKEQTLCRESCLEIFRICGKLIEMAKTSYLIEYPEDSKRYNCEQQPYRNAGDSPECWYYNKFANFTDELASSESTIFTDCLHKNGSSYVGNISVTASGIPCQSWTEQCPHRHTMNTTYPELNLAKNYCRNPQNSGKRPWCFTTDRNKRWEYCNIPKCAPVDGNYGNWTQQSKCNMSCGQGFEIWKRECNSPEPKYGGKNCGHLGEAVEYRQCFERNCPVNGGYGNWTLSIPCSVSCGVGIEIWRRSCDNPEPKYGGRNCSELGNSIEFRKCKRITCPIDGNYGNWTRSSSCSTTCGKGVETWARRCDNPPGKYGGNCSKHGPAEELRICVMAPCPVFFNSETIGVTTGAGVFLLILVVTTFLFILSRRRRQEGSSVYEFLKLFRRSSPSSQPEASVASSCQEYENLTINGDPIPGRCGMVIRASDYVNGRPSRSLWYDRLQLIRSIAINWLRNAWGNVDESGRHAYDVMQPRVSDIFVPYDKLANLSPRDSTGDDLGNSSETYDQIQRPPTAVVLPSRCGNVPTTELA